MPALMANGVGLRFTYLFGITRCTRLASDFGRNHSHYRDTLAQIGFHSLTSYLPNELDQGFATVP